MAVPMERPKKSTGCGSIGAGILLLALVLVVLLMLLGILPNPLRVKPTATSLPAGVTIEPSPTETNVPILSATFKSTQTLQPTATQTPLPTLTHTPTPTEKPMPFVIKGTPKAYPNSMLFPQSDCEEYLVIRGQLLYMRYAPI